MTVVVGDESGEETCSSFLVSGLSDTGNVIH